MKPGSAFGVDSRVSARGRRNRDWTVRLACHVRGERNELVAEAVAAADQEHTGRQEDAVPEGLWIKCPSCETVLYRTDLEKNLYVCPKCNFHVRVQARERIEQLLDPEGRFEIGSEVVPVDSLKFKDQKNIPNASPPRSRRPARPTRSS
jgi:hypothetical protein